MKKKMGIGFGFHTQFLVLGVGMKPKAKPKFFGCECMFNQ